MIDEMTPDQWVVRHLDRFGPFAFMNATSLG